MSAEKKLHQMSEGARVSGLASYLEGIILAGVLLLILFISNMKTPLGEFVQVMVSWVGRLFGVNYNAVLLVGAILSLFLFKRKGDDFLEKSEKLKNY